MAINAAQLATDAGLSLKSYREIREALEADYVAIFGDSLNTASSSPDGMVIDLVSYAVMEVSQTLQAALANLSVATAEGVYLDRIAAISGLVRADGETDAQLRDRLQTAAFDGLATVDAMTTYLRDRLGDSGVTVKANPEPSADSDGVPGHGVAVYIPSTVTATDAEIGAAIWHCIGAGISSHGSVSVEVTDVAGNPQTVEFSRVTGTALSLSVTVTEYDEETLPSDYVAAIKEALVAFAATEYAAGKDIIIQRLEGVVSLNVQGVETVAVTATFDGTTASSGRIAVDSSTFATLSADNITVALG